MSSKTKTNATKEEATLALVPKLRFPEFGRSEGWRKTPLNAIADPVMDRAVQGEEDNVLSLSAEHGIVLQSEFFGKKVAGDNSERYLKIARNDFVYNDRTTKDSTFGTIKRLSKHTGGIVSPIYKCFRFHADEIPVFWEWYFESGTHNPALAGLVNEGARAGRFNISIKQFLSTSAWRPDGAEQKKMAECLSSVDEVIVVQARKVDALKAHKKGLMQQLFPRKGETQPRLRFSEFQNVGDWEVEPLEKVATYENGKAHENDILEVGQYIVVNSKFISTEGIVRKHSNQAFCPANTGDILMVLSDVPNGRAIAKCFFVNRDNAYTVNQRICKISPIRANSRFLFYILDRNSYFLSFDDGVKQTNLRKDDVLNCPLCLPSSLEEQTAIADCLSSLDALISAEIQKLDALKFHEKGLMQQLFPSSEEVEA